MSDMLNHYQEPTDYADSPNHFSISYSVNVRSLSLNASANRLEIRKHARHLIKIENTVKSPEAYSQPYYSLTPEESLELFINCYESRLSFYKTNPQSEEDEAANDELLNKKAANFYHKRMKKINKMQILIDYNPDSLPADENIKCWLQPEDYYDSCQYTRAFQVVSKKKNSVSSIPFDYSLLTPPVFTSCGGTSSDLRYPLSQPHPDLLLKLNTDLKLRKIELFSLTVFSTSKVPFKMSASWFLSLEENCLFDKMIKPKVDYLLSQFAGTETSLPLNELSSISNINVKRTKLKTLKAKKLKTHADIYEINTHNLKSDRAGSDLISPFHTDYSELFYFMRVSFKLSGGMTFKGKDYAYFEFPVQLNKV
ncbi:unnamed protein product [Ambrosiozyma monospora]|uniref:Unnamed protein product n=1 Tax=Ambrosiozyma monospora TaxID=43982 RepID=A0ACB5SS56_AMBMO|nr:unnamed protein product [Ambrosiozyma monospora]